MKKSILLFPFFLFVLNLASAQKSEGVIVFEEKVNMHKNLPPDAADMKAMIPEWRISKSELLFSEKECLFRNLEEEEDDDSEGQGGVVIKMQRPESFYYRNFEAGTRTDQREFMGKTYLIQDSIADLPWKLSGEAKQVLGYNCLKATWLDTLRNRTVVVWFSEDIPVSAGPAYFGNLPGMVLEANINDGEIIMAASKIDFKKLGKKDIAVPTKGEKMKDDAFNKMVAEKMKEMGGRSIQIRRN